MSERRAFGDRARRQRERRGVTLESIAQSTKVPASLFAALERGDCSRWPGGVYSRAYVRAYAIAVGLDPNETVEDFTAAFADTATPEGVTAFPTRRRAAGALRLSMEDRPDVRRARTIRTVALAGADVLVALAIAWIAQASLAANAWITVGLVLAYYTGRRVLTDEPVAGWIAGRFRAAPASVDLAASEDVSVTDPASTTA